MKIDSELTDKLRQIKKSGSYLGTGVTCEAMSRKIGVSFITVQRWIRNGVSARAHEGTVQQIIRFLEAWEKAKKEGSLKVFFKT